jgi:hypothetical protein
MKIKVCKFVKSITIFIALVLSSFTVAYASVKTTTEGLGDLTLRRMVPETAIVGNEIWVVVEIENTGIQEVTFKFVEKLGDADFDKNQAKSIQVSDPGPGGVPEAEGGERLELWYFEWEIKLPPGESATLAYWIIPNLPGTYVISPAEITLEGEVLYTKSRSILVKCNTDSQCDLNAGETFLTCPEDCFTGMADGFCDGASDGRVDPDCEEGVDPDAIVSLPTPTAVPAEMPAKNLTPYLVLGGAFLAIVAVLVIVGLLIVRQRRQK